MVVKRVPAVSKDDGAVANSAGVIKAIWTLLDSLTPAERQRVLHEIAEISSPTPPSPPKKSGDVLGKVLQLIPKTGNWSIDDLKKQILEADEDTKPKEVYNAVGYLTRKGYVRRISYGRYVTADGAYLVTTDDYGGPVSVTDEDSDQ